jgi:hypothetical protein
VANSEKAERGPVWEGSSLQRELNRLVRDVGNPSAHALERRGAGGIETIGNDTAGKIKNGSPPASKDSLLGFVKGCYLHVKRPWTEQAVQEWTDRWTAWQTGTEVAGAENSDPEPDPGRTSQQHDRARRLRPWQSALAVGVVVLLTVAAYLFEHQDSADAQQGKKTPAPTATADGGPTSPPASSSTLSSGASSITLSKTSGPQDSVISVTGTGFESGEQVLIEIWPISCKDPFPTDDDHVVVGPAPHLVKPDGRFDYPHVPLTLTVYPRPDCSNGLVSVRATGEHSKMKAQVEFHFN